MLFDVFRNNLTTLCCVDLITQNLHVSVHSTQWIIQNEYLEGN